MTDPTPRTEAGRRLIRELYDGDPYFMEQVIAIEAQARAEGLPSPTSDRQALWDKFTGGEKLAYGCGYRDARTEALDAIREHLRHVSPSRDFDMDHERLRAILTETER